MGVNNRVMISGVGSSCGKTTVTCALLKALVDRGEKVAAFKCGPDYIDPMFHEKIIGAPSSNLDLFLCGANAVRNILGEKGGGKISIIEGVMGFYDGLGGITSEFSSHDLSCVTDTPVLLVVDCKGKSLSLAAEISGFLNFLPNNIKGVILNSVSSSSEKMYRQIVENNTDVEIYGFLPKIEEISIKSRHLGLVTAGEIEDIGKKVKIMGETALKYIDLDKILTLAENAPNLIYDEINFEKIGNCRLGVAKDVAFCFYYKENLELLEKLGAELVYFSPISDSALPSGLDGLIFGGGYPELYIKKLSNNFSFLKSVKSAVLGGMPIFAECGGFMYLQKNIKYKGEIYPMCEALDGESFMTDKLVRFGYIRLKPLKDNKILGEGQSVNAHEFHYFDSSHNGNFFLAEKASGTSHWKCIEAGGNIFAGYPHIHFYGNMAVAENFIKSAIEYKNLKLSDSL